MNNAMLFLVTWVLVTASPAHSIPSVARSERVTQMAKVARSFEPVLSQGSEGSGGHMDVEHLLEACRTYADVMREMGQSVTARDMESNIRKAEQVFLDTPLDRRRCLSSLLQIERETGIHRPGGVLNDRSAANGLLWLRRSLAFQNDVYSALLDYKDPTEAALDAYRSQVQPYHGWVLRKAFTAKFSSRMPPRRDMLATLGGFDGGSVSFGQKEEEATLADLRDLVSVWQPMISHWRRTFEDLDLEDLRRV